MSCPCTFQPGSCAAPLQGPAGPVPQGASLCKLEAFKGLLQSFAGGSSSCTRVLRQTNLGLCALWVLVGTLFPLPAILLFGWSQPQGSTKHETTVLAPTGKSVELEYLSTKGTTNLNDITHDPTEAQAARSLVRSSTCRRHQRTFRHCTSSAGIRRTSTSTSTAQVEVAPAKPAKALDFTQPNTSSLFHTEMISILMQQIPYPCHSRTTLFSCTSHNAQFA